MILPNAGSCVRPTLGAVFVERKVGPGAMVAIDVLREDAT